MVAQGPPGKSSTVFLDACAILNYMKPTMLNQLLPHRPLPPHATTIRDFMTKCGEKGLSFHTSDTVYDQVKRCRFYYRRELAGKVSDRALDRVIAAIELKIKLFLSRRAKICPNLSNKHFPTVETFFKNYQSDTRLLQLWQKKCQLCEIRFPTPLPDMDDMQIFSQALNLPDLYFITTDGHFDVLRDELDKQFGSTTITHTNAYEKMRSWGWQ